MWRTHTSFKAGKVAAAAVRNPVRICVLQRFWTEKFDGSQVWEAKEDVSSEAY
jgi:hypothetical protein